ncbi:MAG: response regulator, partial [Candidatus Neomarinimicrobiota bacterium]
MSKPMNPINEKHAILIVEDSPTQAERLKYLLEENNFQVTVARDGNQALNFLQIQLPDMIISDIVMPEMDGYTLCSKIKSDEKWKDIPVMLLTSLSDSEDVLKGLISGADNFVTKPYSEKALLSQVDYILINKRLRSSHQAELGIEIYFSGKKHTITSNRLQIIDLLLSTYETAVEKRKEVEEALEELKITQEELRITNEHLEEKVLERTLRIEQLYELLKVIRNVNQLIVKTRDRSELIRRTCKIFTESQHFSCAWIVLSDDDGKVTDIAESGHGKLFDPIRANLNKNILPPCAQQALATKELVIRNTHQVCPECPLSANEANHLAFSIALRSGDTTFGTLNVGSSIAEPDEEMISLFEEAAGDIGFALYDMALEEKQKRAEETLQASEARYRRLFEAAKDGILILDYETGEIIDVNPFLIELLDYSYPEFLGKHLWEIGLLKDIAESRSAFKKLQQEAYIRFGNMPLKTRSGRQIEVEFVSNVYEVNKYKVIQCNIRDITERWQVQEALRTSAAKLSMTMEISRLGYWEYDVADDLFTFNDQFYSIFGTTAEKVGGNKMHSAEYAEKFLYPDDKILV